MSRDAKKIFSSRFPFAIMALLFIFAAPTILARPEDASSPQTAAPAKPSPTHHAAAHNVPNAKQKTFSSPGKPQRRFTTRRAIMMKRP